MQDNSEKQTLEVGYISFTMPITMKEAKAVLNKPKTRLAKDVHKYIHAILIAGCRKMIEEKNNAFVNDCKLNVADELKE